MKVAGYVLAVLGGLTILRGINTALTTNDLQSQHKQSVFAGEMGISALLLAAGLSLVKNSRRSGGSDAFSEADDIKPD
jgi:hypothetical protein